MIILVGQAHTYSKSDVVNYQGVVIAPRSLLKACTLMI